MKKTAYVMILAALACSMAACGGKSGDKVQTEAAGPAETKAEAAETETEKAGEAAAETEAEPSANLPDEYESAYFEGYITAFDGRSVTVANDDGSAMTFDMSAAEQSEDTPVLTGSYVEVEYVDDNSDPKTAACVNVLMDIEQVAEEENRDPVIYGTLQLSDVNELVIMDESGEERTFDNQMSRTVTFGELKTGSKIAVTYSGALLDEEEDGEISDYNTGTPMPYAVKVVAEDALNSDEAKANYFDGYVDTKHDDGTVEILTDLADYEVAVSAEDYENIEEEDDVRVYYTGPIGGITVQAERVEVIE